MGFMFLGVIWCLYLCRFFFFQHGISVGVFASRVVCMAFLGLHMMEGL